MNKLANYRDNYWNEYLEKEESFGVEHDEAFEKGFNSVVELDLPVKFHLWTQKEDSEEDGLVHLVDPDRWYVHPSIEELDKHVTTKELYNYWIENIFKIE